MENTIIYAACILGCALQFVLGIGVTLLVRKWFRRAAYFFGFLVPVLIPIVLWFVYAALAHSTPCPPNQVACGEADSYALIILAVLFLFNIVASAIVQFVLWLVLRRRNQSKVVSS